MLYLHFPNSPMFASLPSVSIIFHEFMAHLGTGLPALCLFLWLKKEDDAMSVPIQSTSILLTTLVFIRNMPAAQKTMKAFNTFWNHCCKKISTYGKGKLLICNDCGTIASPPKWFHHLSAMQISKIPDL